MSDEEFDEESFRAYENELYDKESSVSEEEIESEVEEALYGQVHYSFSLPSQEELDEKDGGVTCSSPSAGNQELADDDKKDTEEDDDKETGYDDEKGDDHSTQYIIDLSSDSDNDYEDVKKSTGSAQENWTLITKDLECGVSSDGKRRTPSRYYKSDSSVRCRNCNERGHKVVDCPEPKKISCFLCGGKHLRRRCPNELCFVCHEPGHQAWNCRERRSRPNDQCGRCFAFGHHSKNCPDCWRQYHRTIESRKLPISDRSDEFSGPVYCYNCSERGHYGHECTEERMNYYSTPSYQIVVSYDGHRGSEHQAGHIEGHTGDHQRGHQRGYQAGFQGNHNNKRQRTKTHDGTVGRTHVNERRSKKQREEDRKSLPNQRHNDDLGTGMQGGDEYHIDGRVGTDQQKQIIEGIKKRRRRKDGKSCDHNPVLNNEQDLTHRETDKVKMGSKRKSCGTPHQEESKKVKQEDETMMNKQKKKKKKDYQSAFHCERTVELIRHDEVSDYDRYSHKEKTKDTKRTVELVNNAEVYDHNQPSHKGKTKDEKLEKKRLNARKNRLAKRQYKLSNSLDRMIQDCESLNASSPGHSHRKLHSSPSHAHRTPQKSSLHHYDNKRVRGFRSKRD